MMTLRRGRTDGVRAPGAPALEQCVREVTVPPRALLTLRLRSGQVPQWHTGGRNARPTLNPES